MTDITNNFGSLYHPVKAFIVYQQASSDGERQVYVEAYDMDKAGYPINAHPLSIRESAALAKALDTSGGRKRDFLKSEGLLPSKVLYIDSSSTGFALWHTPAMKADLLFKGELNIPCGKAAIPPLVWKATRDELYVYALKSDLPLDEETPLCYAPFFNVYEDGRVCMGTVRINIKPDCMLEEFMQQWESCFFNSYFSHLIQSHAPVKGNIVQLWQGLVGSRKKFPVKQLITHGLTIKDLIQ